MIPHLFSKQEIPKTLPEEMQMIVNELKHSANKEDCLRKAYAVMTSKYRGYRAMTYIKLNRIFTTDVSKLWAQQGFLHCTQQNYLLRILLVKSGFFKDKDIVQKLTYIWFLSPHQYLHIKLDDSKSVNVDLWGKYYGIEFGKHAKGFQ